MALNQLAQKIQPAKCVQIYLLHQNPFQKEPPREASLRLYSHTRYSANPTLSHIINGSGVNSVSAHFQESYGDLSEADGCWRTERSSVSGVVGRPQILQEQLPPPT
jgi:hypothetical protein